MLYNRVLFFFSLVLAVESAAGIYYSQPTWPLALVASVVLLTVSMERVVRHIWQKDESKKVEFDPLVLQRLESLERSVKVQSFKSGTR